MGTPTPRGPGMASNASTPSPKSTPTTPIDNILVGAHLNLDAPVFLTITYTPGPINAPAMARVNQRTLPSPYPHPYPENTTPIPNLTNLPVTIRQTYNLSTILHLISHSPPTRPLLESHHLTHILSVTVRIHDTHMSWRTYRPLLSDPDPNHDSDPLNSIIGWVTHDPNVELRGNIVWEVDGDDDQAREGDLEVRDDRVWWKWACLGREPEWAEVLVHMGGPWYGSGSGVRVEFGEESRDVRSVGWMGPRWDGDAR